MDLTDAISAAVDGKHSPRVIAVNRVRAALDALLAAERALLTSEITNRALQTIGAETAADATATTAVSAARADLRAAFEEFLPPEPKKVVPVAPRPRPAPRKLRSATDLEKRDANRLIAEIERVDVHQHHLRLLPLLRMLVAEVRSLMEPLSPGDPTYGRLFDAIDGLRIVHRQAGLPHVYGLEISEQHDWADLASRARRALDRFDRDAATPLRVVGGSRR